MLNRKTVLKILSSLPFGGFMIGGLASGKETNPTESVQIGDAREPKTFSTKKSAPIINAAEHAWVINDSDSRFTIDPEISSCPGGKPKRDYSGEHLIAEMDLRSIDKTVISHVCYYGRNNAYTIHCVNKWPGRFAGIGLLVGHRLYEPGDPENPARLERLIKKDGLAGLRLSPIYDRETVWMNDPDCYPLWEKAQELQAAFNIFLAPEQIDQVADMAERFPGVDVVIDHLAMIDITRPDSEGIDPLCDLAQYSNVYIRTSLHNLSNQLTPYRDVWSYLKKVYDSFGPRRMLYANFFEYLIMKELIPFFSEEDKIWILGETAEKIYFKDNS